MDDTVMRVKVPDGYLLVEAKGTEYEYPGVYISFSKAGDAIEPGDRIGLVEFDTSSHVFQTVAYQKAHDEPLPLSFLRTVVTKWSVKS